MLTIDEEELHAAQREVQRLLGRCLLRIQQYERLIKTIVAHYEISGSADTLERNRDARITETNRKTLGTLVGTLLGSVVTSNPDTFDLEMDSSPDDANSFSMRMSLTLPDADFARIEKELDEFVQLRNNLVHHFLDQHDISSLDGCHWAIEAMVTAYSRIDQQFEQLREWAEGLDLCRQQFAAFVRSDPFSELVVNGIYPDGTVMWPAAGIVSALREAADALSLDGWMSLTQAARWINEKFPEQVPAKYGCRSWPQVVHESRLFELRYFDEDGQRVARYRKT